MQVGYINFAIKSIYLANGTTQGHSYNGRVQQKVIYGLLNGAIFNDLERPLTQFSRSRYSLMLDISQTAKDTAIVTKLRIRNRTQVFEWCQFE